MGDSPGTNGRLATILDWVAFLLFVAVGVLVTFGGGLLGAAEHEHMTRTVLGLLFVTTGFLVALLRRTRRDLRRLDDLLTDVRFGSGTRRDRDAVDILIKALRAPDDRARETALRTLKKISGFDFGPDPKVWEEWWASARSTFVRAGAATPDKAGSGKL